MLALKVSGTDVNLHAKGEAVTRLASSAITSRDIQHLQNGCWW